MTKRKTLSTLALGAGASLLAAITALGASSGSLAKADEVSDTRSFALTAQDIGSALEEGESELYAGGLRFAFSGASVSNGLATFKEGCLYNADLAGSKANSKGRIGTGFKKVAFEGLANKGGFTVSFMSDASTSLETIAVEAGSSATEVLLSEIGNAKVVKLTFSSGGGVAFSSITYFYTCGNAS